VAGSSAFAGLWGAIVFSIDGPVMMLSAISDGHRA
jgi:hypothetical protein